MKKIAVTLLISLCTFSLFAQDLGVFFNQVDAFLKTHVKEGKVDYKAIKESPEQLDEILKLANNVSVTKEKAKAYQAFWINAYNISVIKGIIDNYPTNSPLDNKGFFDKTTYALAGKEITLNDIEHKLLRAQFKDPRFHFVLVCGALGCPPLISDAYLPETLDSQLEQQTKEAINGDFLKVNMKKKRIQASQIMEWYKEDFTMNGKSEIDFINTYRAEKVPEKSKISYFTYDWKVNEQ